MSDNRYDRNRSSTRGGYRPGASSPYRRGPQQGHQDSNGRRMTPIWLVVVLDILFLGVALNVYALVYSMPSTFETTQVVTNGTKTPTLKPNPSPTPSASTSGNQPTQTADGSTATPDVSPTEQLVDQGDFGANFPDKFIDGEPVSDSSSYQSRDINISIQKETVNGAVCYIADIYVRNLQNFREVLAKDIFGSNHTESQESMAKRSNAILSINTDNYGELPKGLAVRNGVSGRSTASDDILVLYSDGTMKTFLKGQYNKENDTTNAWQVWSFGPQLLQDGQPMQKFNTQLNPKNPRTAVGYYGPGHYCFVVVDGRQPGYSDGLTMKDLSQFMYDRSCTVAYAMDGGQSTMMYFMGQLVNQPYHGGRSVSNISIIGETN